MIFQNLILFYYRSSSHSHSNSKNSNESSIVFCDKDNKKFKSIIFEDNTIKSKDSIIFTDSNNLNNENNNNILVEGINFKNIKNKNYSSQNLSFNSMKNNRNSFIPNIEISRKKFKSKTDSVNFPYLLNLFDNNHIAKKIYEEPNSDTERSNNKIKKNKKK